MMAFFFSALALTASSVITYAIIISVALIVIGLLILLLSPPRREDAPRKTFFTRRHTPPPHQPGWRIRQAEANQLRRPWLKVHAMTAVTGTKTPPVPPSLPVASAAKEPSAQFLLDQPTSKPIAASSGPAHPAREAAPPRLLPEEAAPPATLLLPQTPITRPLSQAQEAQPPAGLFASEDVPALDEEDVPAAREQQEEKPESVIRKAKLSPLKRDIAALSVPPAEEAPMPASVWTPPVPEDSVPPLPPDSPLSAVEAAPGAPAEPLTIARRARLPDLPIPSTGAASPIPVLPAEALEESQTPEPTHSQQDTEEVGPLEAIAQMPVEELPPSVPSIVSVARRARLPDLSAPSISAGADPLPASQPVLREEAPSLEVGPSQPDAVEPPGPLGQPPEQESLPTFMEQAPSIPADTSLDQEGLPDQAGSASSMAAPPEAAAADAAASAIRIVCLGLVNILIGGEELQQTGKRFRSSRELELMAYLAHCAATKKMAFVDRQTIANALLPEQWADDESDEHAERDTESAKDPRSLIRSYKYRLSTRLGKAGIQEQAWLESRDDDALRLSSQVHTDLAELLGVANRLKLGRDEVVRQRKVVITPEQVQQWLRQLDLLYRSDFAEQFQDSEWAEKPRRYYRGAYLRAKVEAAELLAALGERQQAIYLAERLIEAEEVKTDELFDALIGWLIQEGDKTGLLRWYGQYRRWYTKLNKGQTLEAARPDLAERVKQSMQRSLDAEANKP